MPRKTVDFAPELQQAQENLEVALKEACAVNVKKANTGELIHIDELLAIAGESAKQVISVRRRMRRDTGSKGSASKISGAKASSAKARTSKIIPNLAGAEWAGVADGRFANGNRQGDQQSQAESSRGFWPDSLRQHNFQQGFLLCKFQYG